MEATITRLPGSLLLLLLVAGCDTRPGPSQQVVSDCRFPDHTMCLILNSVGTSRSELQAENRPLQLPRSEQVRLDVAAIINGMQAAKTHL